MPPQNPSATPDSVEASSTDAHSGLRAVLGNAGALVRQVADSLDNASSRAAAVEHRLTQLENRLGEVESDSGELASMLATAERQASRLMNLYVATYQLHATLDPNEVRSAIAEIATNLLGAEQFVLLLKSDGSSHCEVALAEGLKPEHGHLFSKGRYVGKDPMLDATLSDGMLRVAPMEGTTMVAVVPLVVQDATVGALAILKLFDHKSELAVQDRELLDVLAAHAASALFAAQMHATAGRRLKTLESLVELARKG